MFRATLVGFSGIMLRGPLLSTLILILVGIAPLTMTVIAACILVTGGAALASKDMILRPRKQNTVMPTP